MDRTTKLGSARGTSARERGGEPGGVVLRPNHQVVQAHRHLRERHVEAEPPARDLPVPGVLDDADDGLPRRSAVGTGLGPDRDQAPAHGAAGRPQMARERFADHDRGGRVRGVAVGERAARDEIEPHRLEVAGRHGLQGDRRPLRPVGSVERLALEHHAAVHADDPVLEGQQHRPAGRLDPVQSPDAGEELPPGGPPRRDLLVRAVPGGEGEHEHAGWPVAEIDARQVDEAGREEAGPDREDEGHRDLRDDERVARAGSRAPRGRAVRAVAQPRDERHPAGARRRRRGHREREPDGEQRGEGDRGSVDRGLLQPGHVGGAEGDEDRQRRRREDDAARRRGSRDEQGLQQVGAEQAPPADAERAPHRRVAPARLRPHDHQAGHVGTGDQQQERHAAQENEQGGLGVAEDVVGQGRDDRAPRAQPREVRFPQPRHDDVHLRPRLVHGAARGQASDRVEDPEAALRAAVHPVLAEDAGELAADRRPHLGAGRELERGRHDADHRERLAPRADRHRGPDHAGVACRSTAATRRGSAPSRARPRPRPLPAGTSGRADGCAPSVSKNDAETALIVSRTGGSSWTSTSPHVVEPIAAMSVNDPACARQSSKFGSETSMWGLPVLSSFSHRTTSSSWSANGKGCRRTASTTAKSPTASPRPRARVRVAASTKPGCPARPRTA